MEHRARYFSLILAGAALASTPALAVSARTAEIFKKDNRELEPPPKTLRANSENSELRYKSGTERLARKVSQDGADSASASLDPEEEDSEGHPARSRFGQRLHSLSSLSRRSSGFNGERTFGLGFMGAGAYGVFGGEVDFGLSDQWTAGFGVGTGMSYSTWAMHARYFPRQARWSPLLEAGYAQWTLGKIPPEGTDVVPHHLSQRFFEDRFGLIESSKSVHIVYPGIGVLYQHKSGLAALFELQYFIKATDFSGALFGTAGAFFYF